MFTLLRLPSVLLLLGLTQFIHPLSAQEIIPADRRIEWKPGLPGGIPEVNTPEVNVMDHGADSTGIQDSQGAFVAAIGALPATGGVVQIPEGDFRLSSTLSIGKSGVVLRGNGKGTRIISEADGNSIDIVTYQRGDWQRLPASLGKDSIFMQVVNGSLFTAGEFVEVSQENDPTLMYTSPDWDVSWAQRSVGQLFEISRISGNTLELANPSHYHYDTSLQTEARPINLVRKVGLEDFYIEKTAASGHTILLKNSAYCWISRIESYHTRKYHVAQHTCLGNEIRDSYFHRSFDYGGGGSAYGVECGYHVTSTLVENNIFDSLRHAMMVQLGASGNVFGYNYSAHPVQGSGESMLNQGWDPPDLSIHGHFPLMNLFEGNDMEEVGIGDYWGPAGPGNTYFRNRVNSSEGIIYYDASHGQNVVGNITIKINNASDIATDELEHGNVINGIVHWDPDISHHELLESYYLSSVPSFMLGHSWPVFGPDVDGVPQLPAQLRYNALISTHTNPSLSVSTIRIWPNPCTGILQLDHLEPNTRLRVMEISGRVVQDTFPEDGFLDLSDLPGGLYLIEFISPNGKRQLERVIRQ